MSKWSIPFHLIIMTSQLSFSQAETKHKLGYADPEKIELICPGEHEDSLI